MTASPLLLIYSHNFLHVYPVLHNLNAALALTALAGKPLTRLHSICHHGPNFPPLNYADRKIIYTFVEHLTLCYSTVQ